MVVAEPVLASLHEPDQETGLGVAEPWGERAVETDAAAASPYSADTAAVVSTDRPVRRSEAAPMSVPQAVPPQNEVPPPREPAAMPSRPPRPLATERGPAIPASSVTAPVTVAPPPDGQNATIRETETIIRAEPPLLAPPPGAVRDMPPDPMRRSYAETVPFSPAAPETPAAPHVIERVIRRDAVAATIPPSLAISRPGAPSRETVDPIVTAGRDIRTAPREVRVSIGQVELHAAPPRVVPHPPAPVRRPSTSLSDYLAQKSGRRP